MTNLEIATNKQKKPKIAWEGRETAEWWWGGKTHPTQRFNEHDPEDDNFYS